MKKRIIQISLLVTVLPLMSLTVQAPDEETDGSLVVNYKGSRPVITDFIDAFLTEDAEEGSDCDNWKNEWADYRRGKPLEKRQTFTVDVRNGYVRMENKFEGGEITFHEFCFWNCSDGKHKLLVEYVGVFVGGKVVETECTGLLVYRYDNAILALSFIPLFVQSPRCHQAHSRVLCRCGAVHP